MVYDHFETRALEIFRELVDVYVHTGEPVGSRTLAERLGETLSPATIRNIMARLEAAGFLYSPHTSAGRLPTERGLRFYVDGILEFGDIQGNERALLEQQCRDKGRSLPDVLEEVSVALSGLTSCAGLVIAPKRENTLRHVEFLSLDQGRALMILVTEDGNVENRILTLPPDFMMGALVEVGHYLNERMVGMTLPQAYAHIQKELSSCRIALDEATQNVIEKGLAEKVSPDRGGTLVVRGQAQLLNNVSDLTELDHVRHLFDMLEKKENLLSLVEASLEGDGVRIFIGAENELFHHAGCALILSPYKDAQQKVVGAVGVVGPARMNYGKIVPMVDYTARLLGQLISE